MRRGIWLGAAVLIAIAAALPLWLVMDDGGVRRLGAIDATSTGQAGQLTLAGVNGGAPFPIDSFAFRITRPVGAAQPDQDSIEVALPLGTNMSQLVGRVANGTKAATGKVELVRIGGNGTPTAYLTFDLTGVSVDGFDDSFSTASSGAVSHGAEEIVLRYDGMTMTCNPSSCAEPTHQQGTATELGVPDLGPLAVRLKSGRLAVPKNLKDAGAAVVTVEMGGNYILPGLFSRAREGKAFEKTVLVEPVRLFQGETVRKAATYKLGAAAITSLAISNTSEDFLDVQVQLSSRHFGVTTYTYTNTGAPDKSSTFCFTSCAGL
jgi:type VI protein secretion system component Hcp